MVGTTHPDLLLPRCTATSATCCGWFRHQTNKRPDAEPFPLVPHEEDASLRSRWNAERPGLASQTPTQTRCSPRSRSPCVEKGTPRPSAASFMVHPSGTDPVLTLVFVSSIVLMPSQSANHPQFHFDSNEVVLPFRSFSTTLYAFCVDPPMNERLDGRGTTYQLRQRRRKCCSQAYEVFDGSFLRLL